MIDQLTYGHYILTARKPGEELQTRDKDYIAAGTVNWASQISFEPPMIVVAVGQKTDLNETIDYSGHFALHLLGDGQRDMIEKFAHTSEIDHGRINGIPYTIETEEIALQNTLGRIVCQVEKSFNTGDHTLYIGKVVREDRFQEGSPICTKDTQAKYNKDLAEV